MKKRLNLFLICHTVLWTFLPLVRKSLPMDSLEAIVWGNFWQFGTNKHPPLSGFLIAPLYSLLGESPVAVYGLSQICILIALWFTYKLGKLFLTKENAVLATLLMEGIFYYTVLSCEYNVNIVSLALWPMNTYYFARAMKTNRMKHWGLLGFTAGLNLLTKYTASVLLASFGLYLLLTKQGRSQMKRVGAYVTAGVCLLTVSPHVYWLFQYDFYFLSYIAGRAVDTAPKWTDRFYFPVKFMLSQLSTSAVALLIYFGFFKRNATKRTLSENQAIFLAYTGILPVLMLASVSLITAIPLKSMWGTPFMYMTTILLFYFFPMKLSDVTEKRFVRLIYATMIAGAIVFLASITFKSREKVLFDSSAFAQEMTDLWKKSTHDAPLRYVGGRTWYVTHMALFATERPTAVVDDLKTFPWLNADDILEKGALIIVGRPEYCAEFTLGKAKTSTPKEKQMTFKSLFGKPRTSTIYTCILKPKAQRDDSNNEKTQND